MDSVFLFFGTPDSLIIMASINMNGGKESLSLSHGKLNAPKIVIHAFMMLELDRLCYLRFLSIY